jgi:hypothetical protein
MGLTPEEREVLNEYLDKWTRERTAMAGLKLKVIGSDAIEDQYEKVSPDVLALAAVQGLLAGGMDASAVAGIAWKLIVPTFFMEANQYWEQVRLTGSLAPLLAPSGSETSS